MSFGLEILEFLSITVFREFWGWKFWNFLSITVFCEVEATKHCNAQTIPNIPAVKTHEI